MPKTKAPTKGIAVTGSFEPSDIFPTDPSNPKYQTIIRFAGHNDHVVHMRNEHVSVRVHGDQYLNGISELVANMNLNQQEWKGASWGTFTIRPDAFANSGFEGTFVGHPVHFDESTSTLKQVMDHDGHGYGVFDGWRCKIQAELKDVFYPDGSVKEWGDLTGFVYKPGSGE